MATYYARKAGNINAADVWATTPNGVAGAVTFASGDVLMANSFTITVNVSTDLGSTGEVRIDTTGGATSGGIFTLSSGVTLTANVFGGSNSSCVSNSVTASIVGNIRGGTSGNAWGVINTGTINITGNITGGSGSGAPCYGVGNNASTGIINVISGNVVGGSNATQGPGVFVGGGTVSINGTVTGGAAVGLLASSTGNATITGTLSGGASNAGASNTSASARITVIGSIIGGSGAVGATNTSTGTIEATRVIGNAYGPGNTGGLTAQVAVANSGMGIVEIEQLEFGAYGQSPVSGTGIRLKKANTNVAVFPYCNSAGAKTLVDATQGQMPAASDVRSGVSYASGALTGSCAVPAAGSVALGVPVDATTGSAVLTPAAVWDYAARTITGGTVDTLTNAPTVPSASAIASQVRTELTTELGRIDAAISTRATPANIPTAEITAIKNKTDALNTTRLGQVATTEIVGSLLAQANS